MALKECPRCRAMIRASAARCRCGQEFDTKSIVKKTSRRCPLCGRVEDGAAASCECGYDFLTPTVDVRRQLVRRKQIAMWWIGAGVSFVAMAGVSWFFKITTLGGALIAAAGSSLIARGIVAHRFTRGELATIDAKDRALPQARLLE